jgi:hypothetical protein
VKSSRISPSRSFMSAKEGSLRDPLIMTPACRRSGPRGGFRQRDGAPSGEEMSCQTEVWPLTRKWRDAAAPVTAATVRRWSQNRSPSRTRDPRDSVDEHVVEVHDDRLDDAPAVSRMFRRSRCAECRRPGK